MTDRFALSGARIFDGATLVEGMAVIVSSGRIEAVVPVDDLDPALPRQNLDGGILAPGFIDAQVNGGGGIMLNDDPSERTMARIAKAHRAFGTTALLPTLITDETPALVRALDAACSAVTTMPGVVGLHLEGPHLAPAKKGAHPAEFMRPLTKDDVRLYSSYARAIGTLLLTVAPEQITPSQVAELVEAGIIVSLGHSNATAMEAKALFDAGARGATHLFNAMSQLGNREPGLVGASLDHPSVWCGIIADGHHVDPVSLRTAVHAKIGGQGAARLFLVTDAMALVGTTDDHFMLHGRPVKRASGGACARLTLEDGTLAGSDLDMTTAIRFTISQLGLPLDEALAMATAYPARFLGLTDRGLIKPGMRADLVHLDETITTRRTWIAGKPDSEAL